MDLDSLEKEFLHTNALPPIPSAIPSAQQQTNRSSVVSTSSNSSAPSFNTSSVSSNGSKQKPSNSQNWRQLPGGLHGLASKFGEHNSASKLKEEHEAMLGLDEDFRMAKGAPDGDFESAGTQMTTLDTKLSENNVGFRLLMKMGWKKDTGLGRNGSGIVDPIQLNVAAGTLGLGKAQEYEETSKEATRYRKQMEAEIQVSETPERKKAREDQAAKDLLIQTEVQQIVDIYRCDVCNKQYPQAMAFEEHLSSYDHHHRKRFVESQKLDQMRKLAAQPAKNNKKSIEDEMLEARMKAASGSGLAPDTSKPESVQQKNTQTATPISTERTAVKLTFASKPKSSFVKR